MSRYKPNWVFVNRRMPERFGPAVILSVIAVACVVGWVVFWPISSVRLALWR